jgi:phage terminase Nu1 subunit (DNA packaging protein)
MSPDTDAIGLREFGRQLGVSGEAIRKAIATGRIPADCIGERVVGKGQRRPVITDPARATEQWNLQRDPVRARDKASPATEAKDKQGRAQRRGEAPPEADDVAEDADVGVTRSITESRAITEDYKARMARLDFEERSGMLVNAEQVQAGFVNMITSARNALLGVPTRAKQRMPQLTVQDVETLERLISEALEAVAIDAS